MTPRRLLAVLALAFALAHAPFLAPSLEDIDSVNFALGIERFDVAQHRPHPPGYPIYVALGKAATAVVTRTSELRGAAAEARAMAALSLVAGAVAFALLYVAFACLGTPPAMRDTPPWRAWDVTALGAAVVAAAAPLWWYLASRPMSDLPGFACGLAADACLLYAWWRQAPAPDGDRRLQAPALAASGRMIVAGALLAGLAIGVRSQTMWYTLPLLLLVLADRIGRGVAGAIVGSAMTFTIGGLLWGVPLLVASGGPGRYLAALGSQAGEDFTSGEMLIGAPSIRFLAIALWRSFVDPWDSPALAFTVLALAAIGVAHLAWKDRRALAAIVAMGAPYLVFHLLFQDTSFVRYALPLVPLVAWLAVRGVSAVSPRAPLAAAAALAAWGIVVATPVLADYAAEPGPVARVADAMRAAARQSPPGALAMHQTFVRPLEADPTGITPQLPSPPRLEWLAVDEYWSSGTTAPLWFLADPSRSDLALFDPQSLRDATDFGWSLVARPAFGGLRPSAVRWYRMRAPGWYGEEGWALTPETAGMAELRHHGPALAPIVARVRRRPGPARVLVGGRNLAGPDGAAASFTLAIDGVTRASWDAPPGFFLRVFDLPEGALAGEGPLARLTIASAAADGGASPPTAIEQFDLQDPGVLMWGYGEGWHESEYSAALGVWRWTSDRAVLRIVPADGPVTVRLPMASPASNFDTPPRVRLMAGPVEIASTTVSGATTWVVEVPADRLAAAGGYLSLETDHTFVPLERGGPPDKRRLGLRIFAASVSSR